MKRTISSVFLGMLTMVVFAQNHQGIALTMGYAQPTMREGLGRHSQVLSELSAFTGFGLEATTAFKGTKFGLLYDGTIAGGFGAAIGVNYTMGADFTSWTAPYATYTYSRRAKSQFHSIEIPVDWQYKFEVATNTFVIIYTGPTISMNVSATQRFVERMNDNASEQTFKALGTIDLLSDNTWYDANHAGCGLGDEYNNSFAYLRYNVFWGVGVGFQYKQFFIRGGYDFGLINGYKHPEFIYSDGEGGTNTTSIRSRLDQWQIKLGIFLWHSEYKW